MLSPRVGGLGIFLLLWSASAAGAGETWSTHPPDDTLPVRAVARLGSLRFLGGGEILALAVSADGALLASWGTLAGIAEKSVQLEDARTRKIVRLFALPPGDAVSVRALAFSPDRRSLAAASGRTVYVWEITGKKPPLRFQQHRGEVTAMAFPADGRHLITAEKGVVHLWDLQSGRQRRKWRALAQGLPYETADQLTRCFAQTMSADGRTLAWGLIQYSRSEDSQMLYSPGGFVRICDGATGRTLRDIPSLAEHTLLSPDGKTLATASNYRILLSDVATGRVLGDIQNLPAAVVALVFSPDGKTLLSAHRDRAVYFWDAGTGTKRSTFPPVIPSDRFRSHAPLAYFIDGKTLAVGGSPFVRLRAADGSEVNPVPVHLGPVAAVHFSADGKGLTSRSGGEFYEWDLNVAGVRDCIPFRLLRAVPKDALAVSEDGKWFVRPSPDGAIWLEDAASGKGIRPLEGRPSEPAAGGFSADRGKVALFCPDKAGEVVRVYNCKTGARAAKFTVPGTSSGRALSADGRWLAFSHQGETAVVETATGAVKILHKAAQGPTKSKDLLAVSVDGNVLVRVPTVAPPDLVDEGRPALWAWRVRSGRNLLNGAPGEQAPEDDLAQRRIASPRTAACLSVSPDGRLVALGQGDNVVRVWEVASGKLRCRLEGHRGRITALAFSADGTRLASGSQDTTILVWDMTGAWTKAARKADLSPDEANQLWDDLASTDGGKAEAAVWNLAAAPLRAVTFLKGRLQPVPHDQSRRLRALLSDLDSEKFATREAATAGLEQILDFAQPTLTRLVQEGPSLEVRRRVETLLKKMRRPEFIGGRARESRALEVLERIGTAEARALVRALASGAPEAPLTEEAEVVQRRLARTHSPEREVSPR
jgi:WD40 repeat protein